MRGTISNGHTQVNVPYLQDFSLKRHHWAQRIRAAGNRLQPIQRRARTNQVEVVIGAEKDARRGSHAEARPASLGPGKALKEAAECRELPKVEGMGRVIGTGEMTHRMHDRKVRQQGWIG